MKTVALPSNERVPAFGMGTWQMGESRAARAEEAELRHRAGEYVPAVVGVLIHDADRLLALLLGEVLYPRAHLVVVRGELPELKAIERLVHRAGARCGKHVRHVLLEHHRHHRVVHRRAAIAQSQKNVVAVHQLVHRLNRLGHLVLHVLDDVLDFASVHAAIGVGFVERHAHGVDVVHRLDGSYTG